jgi:hypothetical protein
MQGAGEKQMEDNPRRDDDVPIIILSSTCSRNSKDKLVGFGVHIKVQSIGKILDRMYA